MSYVALVVTARRSAYARSLLSPSDCPYVTLVYCIQMAECIVKLVSRPGSPFILFFTPSAGTKFQGIEPIQRGRKIHWGGKYL